MNRVDLLSSFVNGFDRTEESDVINAIYIAKNVFSIDFRFNFRCRGSRGVDSSEIRKLLFFTEIRTRKNHEKTLKAAEQLSKMDSKHLGWLAQYIMNGETHLYKKEAKKAAKIRRFLLKVNSK